MKTPLFILWKKKYKVKEPNYAIHASRWWGFGPSKNTIILYDNCLKHNDNWVGDGAYDIPQPYELNGGEKILVLKAMIYFILNENLIDCNKFIKLNKNYSYL